MDLSSLHPALIATNLEKSLESFSDESEWEKLGEGGFSTVYKAKFKEQHIPVALKTLKRPVDLSEVAVLLKAMTSDYIVNIKAVIRADSSNMCSHIAMELLSCDLKMLRNNIKISQAKWSSIWPSITSIYLDVCRGFSYLHSCDISHCDIKPSNILISHSLQAKVTDCGLARLTGVDSGTSSQGTVDHLLVIAPSGSLPYISPQLLENPDKAVTEYDDLYSFGLLVYKGITNENLFEMEGNENMTDARINDFKMWVLKNKDRPEVDLLPKFCTPEKLKKMITSCWNHEPISRNSFEHWVGTLEDQYNTYTEEEKDTAKKALETAVTAVIRDEDLPQISSKSIIESIFILNQVGQKLDPPNVEGSNWRNVAAELGFNVNDIDLIDNNERDPTKAVLQVAFHRGVDVSPERLIEIAEKIKRTDVVNDIQNWLQSKETERLDVTDSATPLKVFAINEFKVFEVLRVLDVAHVLGNDWTALAGKLEFNLVEINKIKQSCSHKEKSPTSEVLKTACQQAKLKSYQHLIELLTEVQRPDVATNLKQVLQIKIAQ